jgi:hypothetical protein
MSPSKLHIATYNFNLKIDHQYDQFREYIIDVLEQQFGLFNNVKAIAISLKTYDEKGSGVLSPAYSELDIKNNDGDELKENSNRKSGKKKEEEGEKRKKNTYNEFVKIINKIKIEDEELFFKFYKKASDYGKKVFIVTKDNKEIYKIIEDKLSYCKVFDAHTIQTEINKDVEIVSFINFVRDKDCKIEKTNKKKLQCGDCDSENIINCFKKIEDDKKCNEYIFELIQHYGGIILNNNSKKEKDDNERIETEHYTSNKDTEIDYRKRQAQIMSVFEQYYIAPENNNWTMIAFPYFFLNQFLGTIGVVFEDFEAEKIESYIHFLSTAKNSFHRGIIYFIANDFCNNNNDNNGIKFKDIVNYFMDINELNGEKDKYITSLLKSHFNKNENEENGDLIYMPLIRKGKNKEYEMTLPFVFSESDTNSYCFEFKKDIVGSEEEIRQTAFELITHIQWLWDFWKNRKGTGKYEKNEESNR